MKEIKNYEGLYSIEEDGRVWSHRSKKYLRESENVANHYMKVCLCKNGKTETKYIHRLVAETYLENPDNLPQVDHKDRDKANNHVSNLRWVSRKTNLRNTKINRAVEDIDAGIIYGSIAEAAESVGDKAANERSATVGIC